MFSPVVHVLLLASSQVTIGTIMDSSPKDAGDLLLSGHTHDTIVAIVPPPEDYLGEHNATRIDLLEQPISVGGGCTRRRWAASFRFSEGTDISTATFFSARPITEVALVGADGCDRAEYKPLPRGMTAAAGIALLKGGQTTVDKAGRPPTDKH